MTKRYFPAAGRPNLHLRSSLGLLCWRSARCRIFRHVAPSVSRRRATTAAVDCFGRRRPVARKQHSAGPSRLRQHARSVRAPCRRGAARPHHAPHEAAELSRPAGAAARGRACGLPRCPRRPNLTRPPATRRTLAAANRRHAVVRTPPRRSRRPRPPRHHLPRPPRLRVPSPRTHLRRQLERQFHSPLLPRSPTSPQIGWPRPR